MTSRRTISWSFSSVLVIRWSFSKILVVRCWFATSLVVPPFSNYGFVFMFVYRNYSHPCIKISVSRIYTVVDRYTYLLYIILLVDRVLIDTFLLSTFYLFLYVCFPASPLSVHNSLFIYCQYNHIKSTNVAENPHIIFQSYTQTCGGEYRWYY